MRAPADATRIKGLADQLGVNVELASPLDFLFRFPAVEPTRLRRRLEKLVRSELE